MNKLNLKQLAYKYGYITKDEWNREILVLTYPQMKKVFEEILKQKRQLNTDSKAKPTIDPITHVENYSQFNLILNKTLDIANSQIDELLKEIE